MTNASNLLLNVPLVGQQHGYDGRLLMQPDKKGNLVPHGKMACWYAAAEMVSKYSRPGPRFGLPKLWQPDKGLEIEQIDTLAKSEGLLVVLRPSKLTRDTLLALLKSYGPLWAARTFGGEGHVVVITGIEGESVHYNDPWEPSKKTGTIVWLVAHLLPYHNALLAKDPARS